MANTGYKNAGTVANDAGAGDTAWTSTTNAQGASDTINATSTFACNDATAYDNIVSLVIGGSVTGSNYANANAWASGSALTWVNYGGATDKWGLTPTVAQIKSSDFGVAISGKHLINTHQTNYLKATNFDFSSIPDTATITGINVGIYKAYYTSAPFCFLAGTKISTPNGVVNIEDLNPGDRVYSSDKNNRIVVSTVDTVFKTLKHKTVVVKTGNKSVVTTENHPFSTDKGWVEVKDLRVGDVVNVKNGDTIDNETIIEITYNNEKINPITYDLEIVEDEHNFFANDFLVHNISSNLNFLVDAFRINVFYTTGTEKIIASSLGILNQGAGRMVVRTSAGVLYALIESSSKAHIYKSVDGVAWSEQDSGNAPTASDLAIALAIDSTGLISILYGVSTGTVGSLYYNTFSTITDTFGGQTELWTHTDVTYGASVDCVAVSIDSNDVPHVVFRVTYGSSNCEINYINKVGGSWNSVVTEVTDNGGAYLDFTIDNNNLPVFAAYISSAPGSIQAFIGNANNATDFTPQTVIQEAAVAGCPIVADSSNNIWVAYKAGSTNYITLRKHNAADNWSTWQPAVTDSKTGYLPTLVADGTDIYVLYQSGSTGGNIIYEKYNGGWSGETIIETATYNRQNARFGFWVDNGSGGPLRNATYYFDAHLNSTPGVPDDPDSVWSNDANAFNGSVTTFASVGPTGGSPTSLELYGKGTNASGNETSVISQVRARMYCPSNDGLRCAVFTASMGENLGTIVGANASWSAYITLTTPTGGWNWTKINELEASIYRGGGVMNNGDSVSRVEIEVITSTRKNGTEIDYLFDDGSTVYWDKFSINTTATISADTSAKSSMRTTYYNGYCYNWKLEGSGGQNRGFQS